MKFIDRPDGEAIFYVGFASPVTVSLKVANFGDYSVDAELNLSEVDELVNELIRHKRAILEEQLKEIDQCNTKNRKNNSKSKKKEKE